MKSENQIEKRPYTFKEENKKKRKLNAERITIGVYPFIQTKFGNRIEIQSENTIDEEFVEPAPDSDEDEDEDEEEEEGGENYSGNWSQVDYGIDI